MYLFGNMLPQKRIRLDGECAGGSGGGCTLSRCSFSSSLSLPLMWVHNEGIVEKDGCIANNTSTRLVRFPRVLRISGETVDIVSLPGFGLRVTKKGLQVFLGGVLDPIHPILYLVRDAASFGMT
jgi:hypothetical protein